MAGGGSGREVGGGVGENRAEAKKIKVKGHLPLTGK